MSSKAWDEDHPVRQRLLRQLDALCDSIDCQDDVKVNGKRIDTCLGCFTYDMKQLLQSLGVAKTEGK